MKKVRQIDVGKCKKNFRPKQIATQKVQVKEHKKT